MNMTKTQEKMVKRYVQLLEERDELEFKDKPTDALTHEMKQIAQKAHTAGWLGYFKDEVTERRLGIK